MEVKNMIGEIFKFPIPEGVMVLIPEGGKLFLMKPENAEKLPCRVSCEAIKQPNRGLLTSTTIVLTERCNLRCSYCYENAGESGRTITTGIIEAVLDLIIQNALFYNVKTPRLNLFGGEPTLAWDELIFTIDRFKKKCHAHDLDGRITLITNGVVKINKLSKIIDDLTFISLSFDGPQAINDRQRGLPGGKSSTGIIAKTASFLLKERGSKSFAIRTTVMPENVKFLTDIHRYFSSTIPGVMIRYEPVFLNGRAKQDGKAGISLDIEEFGNALLACLELPNSNPLQNSIFTVDAMAPGAFCSACGLNLYILPNGKVFSCYRNDFTSTSNAPHSPFSLGRFNPDLNMIEIDQEKLHRLQELHIDKVEACKGCFARYSCRGGCPAIKNSIGLDPWRDSFVDCEKIKKITLKLLRRKLLSSYEVDLR